MQEPRQQILDILHSKGQATVDELVADLRSRRGDDCDDLGRWEHAGLGGMHTEIGGDGANLGSYEIGRNREHRINAARVLRRNRGDGRAAVHVVCGKGLEVRLNPGASA